jgi:hypothetical protein
MLSRNSSAPKKRFLFFALLGVFLAVLLPRIFELDKFATIDEPEWIYQGGNFYYALGQRDFAGTYRRNHPGVTTMWAGAVGFLLEFPEYRGLGQGYLLTTAMGDYLESKGKESIDLLEKARMFIVVGTAITLTLAFYYAWRLFGPLPAFIGVLFLAFDPFHTALSRVLHHDGTLSNLTFLVMLALMSYFYRGRKPFDLAISATAAGLSFLAKVYGLFNFLFAGFIILILYWHNHFSKGDRSFSIFARRYLLPGLIWSVIGIGAIVLFWPALWVDPINTLVSFFKVISQYTVKGNTVFYMGALISETNWATKYPLYYPINYAWRSTPLILTGLVFTIILWIKKLTVFRHKEQRMLALFMAIFAILFTTSLYFSKFKADRYQLAIHPPLDLLAGLGWAGAITWASQRFSRLWKPLYTYILVVLLFLVQAIGTLQHYPYYFTYMNPLLGSVDKGVEAVNVGWGMGLDQVADYLNSKPNAEELVASAPFGAGGLSFFFKGETIYPYVKIDKGLSQEDYEKYKRLDYIIRYTPCQLYVCGEDIFAPYPAEKEIWINEILIARIYNTKDIPEEDVLEWVK